MKGFLLFSANSKNIQNVFELDAGNWTLQPNTELELPMDQEIVFKGEGIKRFLVITPDVVETTRVGSRGLSIVPVRFGRTFIHIWDAEKRWTFHIRTLFATQVKET